MHLALAQMNISPSLNDNMETTEAYIRQAKAADADMIMFPEVQLTPFFPTYRREDSPYRDGLDQWCLEFQSPQVAQLLGICHSQDIAASFNLWMRWPDGNAYDTSITVDHTGTLAGEPARMVHVAQNKGFFEGDYYTPSPSGFITYDLPWGKIAVVICYDRHFPESIRSVALQGAQLVLIPAVNRTDEPLGIFEAELRAAAYQNGCYIALCNRCGKEVPQESTEGPTFAGQSLVINPDGEIIGKAEDAESLFVATINLAQSDAARAKRPYLQQRRPDHYEQ